jgi:hypothetical protein
MSYYRKHIVLWNAANDMLHKGSAYLEEKAEKADGIFGSFCKTDKQNVAQDLDASNTGDGTLGNAVILEVNHNNSKCDTELTCSGSPENVSIQPVGKKNVQQLEIDATFNFPCNVPIFGHYYITECYAYQSSQIGVTTSS